MAACDYCDEGTGKNPWQQRGPGSGRAMACESCSARLQKAATAEARSWDELSRLNARTKSEGGELWEAGGVHFWFPPGVATTPTTANLRRTLVSVRVLQAA
jgi:hypothetical protein